MYNFEWFFIVFHFIFRFSKHDQIGEVKIALNQIDLAQTIEEWRDLTSVEEANAQVKWMHCDYFFLLLFCWMMLLQSGLYNSILSPHLPILFLHLITIESFFFVVLVFIFIPLSIKQFLFLYSHTFTHKHEHSLRYQHSPLLNVI